MKRIHVAVAVIENDRGECLLARRAVHQHMGGLWEFPGGKVETGETVLDALQREIREEIALEVHRAQPLLQIPFQYPDKRVLLDVWRVTGFSGTPRGCEGQPVRWVPRNQLGNYDFPHANRAILTALRLPERMLVTGAFDHPQQCLQRVEDAMTRHGIRAVLLRAHDMDAAAYRLLASALSAVCRRHAALLLLNTDSNGMLEQADGLHLTAQRLMACQARPAAADRLLGASCHSVLELQRALAIGVDYVTLSPVQATASHPGEPCLGWNGFEALLAICPVPAFALGGITDASLPQVKALGGFGIAAISAWW